MPFDEVFSARKKVRRIKNTEFERFGFSNHYISAIENKGLLPERDKLDIIVSFVGAVALEQGSEDIHQEQGLLIGAWWESRLNLAGFDPEKTPGLAEQFIPLDPETQEFLFDAMKQGVEGLSLADL